MAGSHYIHVGYKSPLTSLTIKRVLTQSEKATEPQMCSQDMSVFSRNTSLTWQDSAERRTLGDMAQQ